MTSLRRLESDLPLILDDLAMGPYPDYIDDVLAIAAHRRQRPRWASLERWLPMDLAIRRASARPVPWRTIAVLAALLLLLALAVVTVGQRRPLPAPFGRAATGPIPYAVNGDLFLGDPATGASRALLTGPEYDLEPMFSRDGSLIVFMRATSATDTDLRIAVMKPDGTGITILSDPIPVGFWGWTADRRLLVVAEDRWGLLVFDPEHPGAPVVLAKDLQVATPVVRPGTNEILFRGKGTNGAIALYVMPATGGEPRAITPPHATDAEDWDLRAARYSPDGSRIAVMHWEGPEGHGHVSTWILDPDGTPVQNIAPPTEFWYLGDPVWSNDGTRIAVNRIRDTSDGSDPVKPIEIINLATSTTVETGPSLGYHGGLVEWAPDDSTLLLQPLDPERGSPRLLDPQGGPARDLSWETDTEPSFQRLALP